MPPNNGQGGQWDPNQQNPYQYGQPGSDQTQQYGQPGSDQTQQYGQPAQGQDPYAQQYDAYSQSHQQYGQQDPAGQNQPWQPMNQGAPAPGAWNQEPPKKPNRLPLYIGIGVVVLAAIIVGIILLVNGNDSDDNTAADTTTSEAASSTDEESSATEDEGADSPQSAESSPEDSDSGQGGAGGGQSGDSGELPADFPVPSSVNLTNVSVTNDYGTAEFTTSDPAGSYDEWLTELDAAGYTVDTPYLEGDGADAVFLITAESPDGTAVTIAYESGSGAILIG